jgi:hypothetical protein
MAVSHSFNQVMRCLVEATRTLWRIHKGLAVGHHDWSTMSRLLVASNLGTGIAEHAVDLMRQLKLE